MLNKLPALHSIEVVSTCDQLRQRDRQRLHVTLLSPPGLSFPNQVTHRSLMILVLSWSFIIWAFEFNSSHFHSLVKSCLVLMAIYAFRIFFFKKNH